MQILLHCDVRERWKFTLYSLECHNLDLEAHKIDFYLLLCSINSFILIKTTQSKPNSTAPYTVIQMAINIIFQSNFRKALKSTRFLFNKYATNYFEKTHCCQSCQFLKHFQAICKIFTLDYYVTRYEKSGNNLQRSYKDDFFVEKILKCLLQNFNPMT